MKKHNLILTLIIVALLLFALSVPGSAQDRQIQMKLDSVIWEKRGGAILYGKSMDGTPVKFLYGYHRGKGMRIKRFLSPGSWFTIMEDKKGQVRNGAKRAKLRKNN